MLVKNDFLNEKLLVTTHAQIRWEERGMVGKIDQWLQPALPYGGQYGRRMMMLAFEDAVFVTVRDGKKRVVLTVLTKEQAITNMQHNGAKFVAEVKPIEPEQKCSKTITRQQHEIAVDHALAEMVIPKEKRLKELCAHGWSEDDERYKFAYMAVEMAKNRIRDYYREQASAWMREALQHETTIQSTTQPTTPPAPSASAVAS